MTSLRNPFGFENDDFGPRWAPKPVFCGSHGFKTPNYGSMWAPKIDLCSPLGFENDDFGPTWAPKPVFCSLHALKSPKCGPMAMRIAVGDRDPDCNVRPRSGCMYICMYVYLNLFSA